MLGVVAPNADGTRDERLPRPGHAIVRRYVNCCLGRDAAGHGALDGFEFPALDEDERYDSLSAIAKAPKRNVGGSHINGFRFFRLVKVAA